MRDLAAKRGLIGGVDEDGTPRLAEHPPAVAEFLEESADGAADAVDGRDADVDRQPGPQCGLPLEDASKHADEERLAGAEAIRGRPDRQSSRGVDRSMGQLPHPAGAQDIDGGVEQLHFTIHHVMTLHQ